MGKKIAVVLVTAILLAAAVWAIAGTSNDPPDSAASEPNVEGQSYAQQQVAKAKAGPIDRFLNRILAPGPLAEAHQEIGSCFACHYAFKAAKETRCASCHRTEDLVAIDRSSAAATHKSAIGTVTCTGCHTDHKGSDATITFEYDHSVLPPKTLAACAKCHSSELPIHLALSAEAQSPEAAALQETPAERRARIDLHENHAKGYAGVSCSECHTTEDWTPAIFVHASKGNVPAPTFSSRQAGSKSCAECHVSEARIHEGQAKYSNNCQACHSVEAWKPTAFTHQRKVDAASGATGSPSGTDLTGPVAHSPGGATGCTNCHAREKPSHGNAFGNACGACHSTKQWTGASAGPLALVQSGLNTTCASCHLKEAKAHLDEPDFGPNCSQCHSVNSWQDVRLDHSLVAGQSCTKCHSPTSETHPQAEPLGITCTACHTTTAWQPASFDHATLRSTSRSTCTQCHVAQSAGKHKDGRIFNADCTLCHNAQNPEGTAFNHDEVSVREACSACHASDVPLRPDHKQFVAQCALCHSSDAWRPATFQHEGVIDFRTKACLSCHAAEYRSHDRTWFNQQTGRTCEKCHDTNRWKPANFNHAAAVASPSRTCLSCHRVPANSPLHRNVAPKGCLACHTLQSWSAIKHGG